MSDSLDFRTGRLDSRFQATDNQQKLIFSSRFVDLSFADGLWTEINAKHGTLVDQYEEEEIPVKLLEPIAVTIDQFAIRHEQASALGREFAACSEFLRAASIRSTTVWVIL